MMEMKGQRWDLHPLWQSCKIYLPSRRVIDAINISVESRSRRSHIIDCIGESNQMFMAVIALLLLRLRHRETELKRTSASQFFMRGPVWHSTKAHKIHEGEDASGLSREASQVYDQWAANVNSRGIFIQLSLWRITIQYIPPQFAPRFKTSRPRPSLEMNHLSASPRDCKWSSPKKASRSPNGLFRYDTSCGPPSRKQQTRRPEHAGRSVYIISLCLLGCSPPACKHPQATLSSRLLQTRICTRFHIQCIKAHTETMKLVKQKHINMIYSWTNNVS